MIQNYLKYILPALLLPTLFSCDKVFKEDNYTAYFGGEIINPKNDYVLFLRDDTVLDTIYLDEQNRFFKKFDSLTPGLYTFQHYEYQYVYFDKNDSLMIRLNSNDFDGSLSFCGKGDQKNNYLIDLYLKNEIFSKDLNQTISSSPEIYLNKINTYKEQKLSNYSKRKKEVNWSEGFDKIAEASIKFHYLYNKELYPFVNSLNSGTNKYPELPENYFSHRKDLDLNHPDLKSFSPFTQFTHMLVNNIVYEKNHFIYDDKSLESNIAKLNVVDSLIKDKPTKNIILNNVAFLYLLDDHCVVNHKKFIDKFLELSTNEKNNKEVKNFCSSVKKIKKGNELPIVDLYTLDGSLTQSNKILRGKKTVIFFWTSEAESHLNGAVKKIDAIKQAFPDVNFIAINVDSNNESWLKITSQFKNDDIDQYRIKNFRDLKEKWVIIKIQRTIILNPDGTIKNGFANLFDTNFSNNL